MEKRIVYKIITYDSFWGDSSYNIPHFENESTKVRFGVNLSFEVSEPNEGFEYIYKYDEAIEPDLILLMDRVNVLKCWNKLRKLGLLHKTVFVLVESCAVDWKCGSFFLNHFRRTFPLFLSYRDDMINKKDIIKCNVVGEVIREIERSTVPYDKRELLCMICAKKKSHISKYEMYSERLKIIDFFESKDMGIFDLYGPWWGEKYRNWRGVIENKREVYHSHKFALCIENSYSKGYITEKLFDALRFGIVPVYAGPSNTSDYIPEDCYIDYYGFDGLEQMTSFLEKMSEDEYNSYLENAYKYIKSSQYLNLFDEQKMIDECISRTDFIEKKKISRFQVVVISLIDDVIYLVNGFLGFLSKRIR